LVDNQNYEAVICKIDYAFTIINLSNGIRSTETKINFSAAKLVGEINQLTIFTFFVQAILSK
jgi:hypothetical protein